MPESRTERVSKSDDGLPLWNVRQLISKHRRGRPIRPWAAEMGVSPFPIERVYRDVKTTYKRFPDPDVIENFSILLGCPEIDVINAFLKDFHPDLAETEVWELVEMYSALSAEDRTALVTVAREMLKATHSS